MRSNVVLRKTHKELWRQTNIRLLPSALLAFFGMYLSLDHGNIRHGSINHKFTALLGVFIFVLFATVFLRVLTKTLGRIFASHHLISQGRAAAFQFVIRIVGYIAILLTILDLLGIPVGKLLLGGAAIGIILGVAAQQALANFFASLVLIISHPFTVGERITINSGGLGGSYVGVVKDIGLTHTKIEKDDGIIVLFPNSALLSGASILTDKNAAKMSL